MPSKQIIGQTVIYTLDLSAPSNKRFLETLVTQAHGSKDYRNIKPLSFGLVLGLVLIFTCHLNCPSLVAIVGMWCNLQEAIWLEHLHCDAWWQQLNIVDTLKAVIWLAHIWYLCLLKRTKEAINCMKTSIAWPYTLNYVLLLECRLLFMPSTFVPSPAWFLDDNLISIVYTTAWLEIVKEGTLLVSYPGKVRIYEVRTLPGCSVDARQGKGYCNVTALSAQWVKLLASFPGLPTVKFLIACSMHKWRRKAWEILSHEIRQCLPR